MSNLNISVIVGLVDRLSRPLRGVLGQVERLGSAAGLRNSLGQVNAAMGGVVRQSARLTAGLGLLGGGGLLAGRGFLETASQYERLLTILETTERSVDGARSAMGWASDFAATTPYELSEVTEAFVKLRTYGMDPTRGLLRTLGDTASAMGRDVMQAVEAIADAVTGENERLKEFGIRASVNKGTTTYSYTDSTGQQRSRDVESSNRAMIQSTLEAIWNEKYGGSMDRLSRTWEGMISNLADHWARFKLIVMDAGLFEWLKGRLGGALDTLNRMAASGELRALAESIGTRLRDGAVIGWQALRELREMLSSLWSLMKWVRDFLGGWKPVFIGLAAVISGPLIASLVSLVAAVAKVGVGLLAASGPIGWILAAIAGLAAAFWYFRDDIARWAVATAQQIEGWARGVLDYFAALPARMAQAGRDIIDGLLGGMREKWASVKAWVGSLASSLPEWIRGPLDMHSPSRVFAALGGDIVRGLEVGMRARERLPAAALQSLVGGLAISAAAVSPVAAMPAGAAPGGAPLSIVNHITITAPAGTDARQLAELVRVQVERATRDAGRRLGGALYDRPDDA